ncbi:hypothetical protein ACHHYP_13361 [Achlya hypogyna]|uniref:Secreted protein n=1 Tax=Achlya hypogyna TaxID=1202772 RepID=A0A1V9YFG3_ACHHY|nr:hypothetical protein ACHHYP_13361 [Achlya hypogyna]
MLRGRAVFAWLLAVAALYVADGGRRFGLRDGVVAELPVFASEYDWLDHLSPEGLPLLSGYRATLAALGGHSIFVVGRNGNLFERFFNGVMWVYMRHAGDPEEVFTKTLQRPGEHTFELSTSPQLAPAVAVTHINFKSFHSILIADSTGRLLQRDVSEDGYLRWIDISIANVSVASTGIMTPKGHFYIAGTDGFVYRWDVSKHSIAHWETLAFVVEDTRDRIVSVVGVSATTTMFVLTARGHLIEYAIGQTHLCLDHSKALPFHFNATAGFVHTHSSIFLVSPSMGLVEFEKPKSRWRVHGNPPHTRVVGGLGGSPTELLVVAEDGTLWQYSPERKWRAHRGQHVLATPPIVLDEGRAYLIVRSDGRLAKRERLRDTDASAQFPAAEQWIWQVYDVPEGTDAPCGYCSVEPGTEDNCIQGTPAEE